MWTMNAGKCGLILDVNDPSEDNDDDQEDGGEGTKLQTRKVRWLRGVDANWLLGSWLIHYNHLSCWQ